jgi:hypothetical protein
METRSTINNRRQEKRAKLVALLGGKCKGCGTRKGKLEFDHIDRATKSFGIAENINRSFEVLAAEALKCQLLCRSCHSDKSHKERGDTIRAHGTYTMYSNGKCRCQLCRQANVDTHKELRERKKITA